MDLREISTADLLSAGIYGIYDAARLTHIPEINIRRWLKGYTYKTAKGKAAQDPLWIPEICFRGGVFALSFRDLLELKAVQDFKDAGLNLPTIRRAIVYIRDVLQTDYAFSNQKVYTDGKAIFSQILDEDGRPAFLDVSADGQIAIYEVVLKQLLNGYIFEKGVVARWYPDKEHFKRVVIDPRICFGKPIIEKTRLKTSTLAAAYKAEDSFDRVADWYSVDMEAVQEAVSFHTKYFAAA